MSSVNLLLAAYDESWAHEWESISAVMKNVTHDVAAWQPPGYENVEPEALPPGTILWHLWHLEECFRRYVIILRARSRNSPQPAPIAARTLRDVRAAADAAFGELRAEIAKLSDDDLVESLADNETYGEFVRMVTRHNAWHAGQIVVVKRLWNARR